MRERPQRRREGYRQSPPGPRPRENVPGAGRGPSVLVWSRVVWGFRRSTEGRWTGTRGTSRPPTVLRDSPGSSGREPNRLTSWGRTTLPSLGVAWTGRLERGDWQGRGYSGPPPLPPFRPSGKSTPVESWNKILHPRDSWTKISILSSVLLSGNWDIRTSFSHTFLFLFLESSVRKTPLLFLPSKN